MDDLTAAFRAILREELTRAVGELLERQGVGEQRGDPLLSVEEAAHELGVKPKTLYEWRRLKKGPTATKVGRLVRYRESDLQGWLRHGRS